jgi:hypothetical protein
MRFAFSFALASLALLASSVALAAPDKSAVTSIAEADADYQVQGEYEGVLSGQGRVGLQIVAMGGGKFEAWLLRGGVPGAGWDRQPKERFSGASENGITILRSDKRAITQRGRSVAVWDQAGRRLGLLSKVQRTSPTMGLKPPVDATVLFANGKASELKDAKVSPDGLLEIGATTAMPVRDFRLHLEFKTPYQPTARGQGRGNSGVYVQRRYEVQILDSFGLPGEFNECGALYRQTPPDVNMALPPLVWQTYDIWFTAAKFDAEGKKTAGARITVWHNGIPVHDNREIANKTGAGQAESDKPLPIHFQNHGNPVQFRNLWIVLKTPVHPAEQVAPPPPAPRCCECVPRCCRGRYFGRLFR